MSGFAASFTETYHRKPYAAIDPTRPELNAHGKFVVVTGGATGIGKAIAVAFAQAGATTIAIIGRRLNKLENAATEISQNAAAAGGLRVLCESADISKRASLDPAVASLMVKAGGIKVDVLVNNAGIVTELGPVVGYSEEDLRRGLEVNVIGAFNTIQSFAAVLANKAHVYNTSSGLAHMTPLVPGFWSYCANKAANIKMFDYVQHEHPEWHVVQIQPGVVATEINAEFDGFVGQDEPELAGQFVVWLASPEAEFLKGKFVWVNWDVDELKSRADEIKNSLLLRVLLNGVVM